jgi:uncharacterized protein YdcH (DUF465 family)
MKSNVESIEYPNDPHERLNYLMTKHRELDDEADSMSRRVRLTPAEQYRLQDIKRARLKARDQIEILRTKLDRNMV